MTSLPLWPAIPLLLFVVVIYGMAKYDSDKFDAKYGKDGIPEENDT